MELIALKWNSPPSKSTSAYSVKISKEETSFPCVKEFVAFEGKVFEILPNSVEGKLINYAWIKTLEFCKDPHCCNPLEGGYDGGKWISLEHSMDLDNCITTAMTAAKQLAASKQGIDMIYNLNWKPMMIAEMMKMNPHDMLYVNLLNVKGPHAFLLARSNRCYYVLLQSFYKKFSPEYWAIGSDNGLQRSYGPIDDNLRSQIDRFRSALATTCFENANDFVEAFEQAFSDFQNHKFLPVKTQRGAISKEALQKAGIPIIRRL